MPVSSARFLFFLSLRKNGEVEGNCHVPASWEPEPEPEAVVLDVVDAAGFGGAMASASPLIALRRSFSPGIN